MNPGKIIGAVAIVIGFHALLGAAILRLPARSRSAVLLRFLYLGGIPILLLCSAAGFWDCYASGDWTKGLVPVAMLLFAANAFVNWRTNIELIDKLFHTKHATNEPEGSHTGDGGPSLPRGQASRQRDD